MSDHKLEAGERDMNAAMEFLVDKLKSGHATVADIGVILADTYKQTDNQSFVLREQSKSIKGLEEKLDEIEPKVQSLCDDQKKAKWVVNGIISIVSVAGITIFTWVYSQGINLKNALEMTDSKVVEIARIEVRKGIEESNKNIKDWASTEFQKKN